MLLNALHHQLWMLLLHKNTNRKCVCVCVCVTPLASTLPSFKSLFKALYFIFT